MEKPWKVIMAFVGVFMAGSVFGGLLALRLNPETVEPRIASAPSTQPPAPVPAASQPVVQPPQAKAQPPQPGIGSRQNAPVAQLPLPPGMAVQAPQLMRRYVDKLDLTAEQKVRVDPLIVRAANDLRRQQQTNLRETGIIIQHLQEDLAKELTAAQRGRLEEMTERQLRIIEQRERQQQEKQRAAQAQKAPAKEGNKPKVQAGKPVDEGK